MNNNKIYFIEEIKEIAAPIAKQYDIEKIYLFGSYARGEATEKSDLDFIIDAPNIRGLFELGGLYSDLESAFQKEIDLVTKGALINNSHIRFKNNLEREKLLIYDKNSMKSVVRENSKTDEETNEAEENSVEIVL